MKRKSGVLAVGCLLLASGALLIAQPHSPPTAAAKETTAEALFRTADGCLACHNGLVGPAGEDISIGLDWRPSMMANSARDPYWQAAVRRETTDHPEAASAIEHECSACHMPMTRYAAKVAGKRGAVFANLPITTQETPEGLLAADGVSCTSCHQILRERLGTRDSFTAGFVIDTSLPYGRREVFGPFTVKPGLETLMRSAADFTPAEASHLASAEMCATCHTLYTHALGPGGEAIGQLPEQVPYLEWRHSSYREEKTCQDCHMPVVQRPVPIASVLGEPREGFSRHEFRGGNFYMPRILNRYGADLGAAGLPTELDAAGNRAAEHLRSEAARLRIDWSERADGRLGAEVVLENLAGHKLPTAYPSRRSWIHFTVRDASGRLVFDSGAFQPSGAITGNDNDVDPARFEPHYTEISAEDQVQIYEVIMGDAGGNVTTGLLKGVRYIKDNRVPPRGFDKETADKDVAVYGDASSDADFTGGGDRVRYLVDTRSAKGPFHLHAELWYQPIGFRWARNLEAYQQQPEPARFVRFYDETASSTAMVIARASAKTR